MRFFVDTADIAAIRELHELGMVDGVTTNPSLILKSGRDIAEVTKEICDIVDGPVSAEVAATDPWRTRRLTLATGLLLPIWGKLPSKGCSVRRVRAPDGRRWLGRVLDEVQAASLKTALGLTEVGDAWADGGRTAAAVLDRNVQLALSGGLWLKRSRVMDRWRLEVVGGRTDRDALVSLGCFVEIIAYAPRVFVPVDRPDVVEGVLRQEPVPAEPVGQPL